MLAEGDQPDVHRAHAGGDRQRAAARSLRMAALPWTTPDAAPCRCGGGGGGAFSDGKETVPSNTNNPKGGAHRSPQQRGIRAYRFPRYPLVHRTDTSTSTGSANPFQSTTRR
jgi:hypothetical protein